MTNNKCTLGESSLNVTELTQGNSQLSLKTAVFLKPSGRNKKLATHPHIRSGKHVNTNAYNNSLGTDIPLHTMYIFW